MQSLDDKTKKKYVQNWLKSFTKDSIVYPLYSYNICLVQLEHLSCPIEYLPCIVNLFILAKFIYLFPFIFGNKEKRIKNLFNHKKYEYKIS